MRNELNDVVALIERGELDEASKRLNSPSAQAAGQADRTYLSGYLAERSHEFEKAVVLYEKTLELAPDRYDAVFRLAYVLDLRGDDNLAQALYETCAHAMPTSVNALLNLAVLYEDRGAYRQAQGCLERILAEYPTHERARLFLRDVRSAQNMYYDEEAERVRQEHDAVLDTPVGDFELSVRSRNCLKQMNINTLGDLLRTTEPVLLAYKNFGETSLNEIKAMLKQKGLRLGQLIEEALPELVATRKPAAVSGEPDVLSRSVTEIELSARSRKCLQRLGVATLAELAARSEADLLAIKNFGQTSLNEIKRRLTEMGLSLRLGPK